MVSYTQFSEDGALVKKPKRSRVKIALIVLAILVAIAVTACLTARLIVGQRFFCAVLDVKAYKLRAAVLDGPITTVANATTREEAMAAINPNLDAIKIKVKQAHDQGVKILVLPEYGITGFIDGHDNDRFAIYPYMEKLPAAADPSACVSCSDSDVPVTGTEIQNTIACLAKQHQMYITANMMEEVPCDKEKDEDCPEDKHYQYNTNIVYDPSGCLIAKYHKMHMYDEEVYRLDHPKEAEHVYFDTPYGRFGTMICMDAIYKEPGVSLVEKYNVDHILFPTAWDNKNDFVYMQAIQWHLAFARRFKTNFLSANIHDANDYYVGSGIYQANGSIHYVFNNDNNNGTLVVANLLEDRYASDAVEIPTPQPSQNTELEKQEFDIKVYGDAYRAVRLENQTSSIKVCHNNLCCYLDYTSNLSSDVFVLAAYDGMHDYEGKYYLQSCVVYKCATSDPASCEQRQNTSNTTFTKFALHADFDTDYVFPVLLPSEMRYEKVQWNFDHNAKGSNFLFGNSDYPIVSMSLIGRLYDKDAES